MTYKEIEVFSQKELDEIPVDFHGRILIKFGTRANKAIVAKRYPNSSVEACGNSSVEARENSSVVARENSSVVARENSSVVACGNSSVVARENSSVVACGNSSVVARENSSVEAWGNSSVVARENSSVVARENSSVEAWGNSSVEAWGNSSVVARENSSVVACGNSSVVARENSSVEAWGNSSVEGSGNAQIVDVEERGAVSVKGNARIVYNPKTPEEYAEHHDLTCSDGYMRLFKAVRKYGDRYLSGRDSDFEYFIGKTINADGLDTSRFNCCGKGIHAAHLAWCLDYGRDWSNLAILEIEMPMETMVVPVEAGKVRADHCRVIREVPLEECGVYGKILAKRKAAEE